MMSQGSVELQLSQKCLSAAKNSRITSPVCQQLDFVFQMKHYLGVWVTVIISHVPSVRRNSFERLVTLVAKEVCICKQKFWFSLTTYTAKPAITEEISTIYFSFYACDKVQHDYSANSCSWKLFHTWDRSHFGVGAYAGLECACFGTILNWIACHIHHTRISPLPIND